MPQSPTRKRTSARSLLRTVLFVPAVLLTLGAAPVIASDGTLEINETCAVQTGCFAGDAAGYPVTITQPGSYRLTGNLAQPSAATAVLRVQANDVTIDLGGFEIAGTQTCPGNPASCAVAGIGWAIDAQSVSGTSVANGAVRGTARGILLADHCRVDGLRVVETTLSGITAGIGCSITGVVVARNGSNGLQLSQGTVTDSAAYDNGGTGFSAGFNATITSSSARRNGGAGIVGNSGSQVGNCVASENTGTGIVLSVAGTVVASSAYNNDGSGISAGAGSTIRFNSAYSNADAGIFASAGSQVIGNTARANTGFGLQLGDDVGYRENVLTSNNGNVETQIGTILVSDTPINLGSNVCGTDTTCP
ncbi:right-handed parallel beta-helix repeat-containing protein [Myxococcota bacterium]|nr:right-handed parallel beta-helix repeat-containing protein [Myxococcota bacterium]